MGQQGQCAWEKGAVSLGEDAAPGASRGYSGLSCRPVSMMHQQAASSHYNSAQGGSQHYQGQPSIAMMGQSGQGSSLMGQRPMAPYRPSQQGTAERPLRSSPGLGGREGAETLCLLALREDPGGWSLVGPQNTEVGEPVPSRGPGEAGAFGGVSGGHMAMVGVGSHV